MDQSHEDTLAAYSALLKAKLTHIAGLSGDQRVALHQQWAVLVAEVKTVLGEDPGSPRSQALLDRWIALLQALTGTDATKRMESGPTRRRSGRRRNSGTSCGPAGRNGCLPMPQQQVGNPPLAETRWIRPGNGRSASQILRSSNS